MTRFWGQVMNIANYHASKFGNGAMVAEEFKKIMAARGVTVSVQHIRDANPQDLPRADLYVFSSPGRMGKPKGNVRRFLRKVTLEPGTRYAILTTQGGSPTLPRAATTLRRRGSRAEGAESRTTMQV